MRVPCTKKQTFSKSFSSRQCSRERNCLTCNQRKGGERGNRRAWKEIVDRHTRSRFRRCACILCGAKYVRVTDTTTRMTRRRTPISCMRQTVNLRSRRERFNCEQFPTKFRQTFNYRTQFSANDRRVSHGRRNVDRNQVARQIRTSKSKCMNR